MAACSKYVSRFSQALAFRKLKFPKEIIDVMGKRATSDRSLDNILLDTIRILEPPPCTKSHCVHHTTYGFCRCSLGRVPGKCDLHLAYRKRLKERQEKQFQQRLAQIPEKYLPLSPENEKRVREAKQYEWDRQVKRMKNQRHGKA